MALSTDPNSLLAPQQAKTGLAGDPALLCLRGLSRQYTRRRGLFGRREIICALADANLDVAAGETVGIVGSSGSGKSTLVRCAALLERTDAGEVRWSGSLVDAAALAEFRRGVQIVFQDSATAFNPRFTAAEIISEPLLVQHVGTKTERSARARELMREVGLDTDAALRRAGEFSGGQRQRLAIARALALQPRLIFLDEALSGLDLSTQAQIANLLLDLQQQRGLAYVLVSHDLTLVARFADRLVVMAAGRIVEQGATAAVLASPQHAETRKLAQTSGVMGARVLQMAATGASNAPDVGALGMGGGR